MTQRSILAKSDGYYHVYWTFFCLYCNMNTLFNIGLRWRRSLAMVPAANNTNILSLVSQSTKKRHYNYDNCLMSWLFFSIALCRVWFLLRSISTLKSYVQISTEVNGRLWLLDWNTKSEIFNKLVNKLLFSKKVFLDKYKDSQYLFVV